MVSISLKQISTKYEINEQSAMESNEIGGFLYFANRNRFRAIATFSLAMQKDSDSDIWEYITWIQIAERL